MATDSLTYPTVDRGPSPLARFARSIPLPRGPQWYLVAYRWLLVVAGIVSIAVTWNLWQDRTVTDLSWAPMLPVVEGLPQVDLAAAVIASLLLILVRPWAGLVLHSMLIVLGMLLDQTRIQFYHQIVFLLWATMPNVNTQMIGRANLIAMWFWAGTHKLLSTDFKISTIPGVLSKIFPREQFTWNTVELGYVVAWGIALTETALGVMCLVPKTRRLVGIVCFAMHVGITYSLFFIGRGLMCNVFAWNVALTLAGFVLIMPWRESLVTTLRQCNPLARAFAVFLLIYPVGYYMNWSTGYLSHCIYVPNTPHGTFYRPGDIPRFMPFMCSEALNVPLPPGQSISRQYFEKIRQPGDMLLIYDPRYWAAQSGIRTRQITDWGELRDGLKEGRWTYRWPVGAKNAEGNFAGDKKQGPWTSWHPNGQLAAQGQYAADLEDGPWTYWHANGNKKSTGAYHHGKQTGAWTFWYDDGAKEMEGRFVGGEMDGPWTVWTPDGDQSQLEFRAGVPVIAAPSNSISQ